MPAPARIPASLILVAALLTLGAAGAAVSLGVQRVQRQQQAEAAARELTGGDPARGRRAFLRYNCGACHSVKMTDRAVGAVGPPLDKLATRAFLAGTQPNDAAHLEAWIQHPQAVEPGVGMPEMDVSPSESRDLAAYLYTLK